MTTSPPNLVLIMCDQMRYDCAGFAGHPTARTPALDRLAHGGVRFENAYCTSPICAPARASWLTGLHPHNHLQLRNYGAAVRDNYGCMMRADAVTIGDVLSDAGYRCGLVGPWHIGDDHKPQHGFHAMWAGYRYQAGKGDDNYEKYLRENDLEEAFARERTPEIKIQNAMKTGRAPVATTLLATEDQNTSWVIRHDLIALNG